MISLLQILLSIATSLKRTTSSQVMDHSATIERNRVVLLRCTNINVDIVACLRAEEVIDQTMESRIEAEKAPHDKLGLLIDWIKKSPYKTYESFLKVMEENEQQHVTNLLKGKEETNHVPLSLARHARLEKIRPKLMHMIHNNVTLIAKLLSSEAISKTDAEDLTADKGPNYMKNFRLINAIRRRSDYSFECLYDALRNCHHPYVADYLMKGETIAVHVNTSPSGLDESLAESLNESLVNEPEDEAAPEELEMPQLNGPRIVGAYPGHSIVILIYCKTTENVVTFTQLFNSGALEKYLQDILNHHFTRIKPESTEKLEACIGLDDEEVLAVEEITGIEDWMAKQDGRNKLPTEPLLDSDKPKAGGKTKEDILPEEHINLILGQYNQLLNNLTSVSEISAYMFQDGRLSLKELELIQQFQSTPIRASEEILNIIMKSSPDVYECFLQSLKETKQDHVYQMLTISVEQIDHSESECEHKLKAVDKTKMDSCPRSSGKSIPPKVPRKPVRLLPVTSTQPKSLLVPGTLPSVPSRLKPVAENRHTSTQHNVNMRQLFNVETQFKRLQNEVQFEVSTKIAVLRKKRTNDNIWKTCFEKIFHEASNRSPTTSDDSDCDRWGRPISLYQRPKPKWAIGPSRSRKETETRLTLAKIPLDEIEAVATSEERKAWREVQSLKNHIQEQSRLLVELRDKLKSYPLLAHEAKRIAVINTKKWIRGLALLDKELFVVSEWSSEIEVYNSMRFSHKWKLEELVRPLDIGSCNRNKCLYILHSEVNDQRTEILRVAPNENLINKWSIGKISGGNLSVTDESNVILTAFSESKLKEFSPDGKLIREINLSSDAGIVYPFHAIKINNGHYVVSHDGNRCERNQVCLVDGDGKLKKSVSTKLGPTIGLASYPLYLAVDRNGFVMVADQMNNRVLLLDSDLEFKGEILSEEKHGLQGPCRILLDKSNYQLFVADYQMNGNRILAFVFE